MSGSANFLPSGLVAGRHLGASFWTAGAAFGPWHGDVSIKAIAYMVSFGREVKVTGT